MTQLEELRKYFWVKITHKRLYNTEDTWDAIAKYYNDRPNSSVSDLCHLMLSKSEANDYDLRGEDVLPFGGCTTITIEDRDRGIRASAIAICGLQDAFRRSNGISIAVGRLIKSLEYSARIHTANQQDS